MYIQMLFLVPPAPRAHKRYILPVSVNLPLLTTLGSHRFPTHVHSFSHVSISKSLNYTTPFSTLLPNVFTSHTRHCTPCRALSPPSPSHPLALNTCIAYLAPNLSYARTHVVYLGHSLETVSLFLPHGGPHSLNLALFI